MTSHTVPVDVFVLLLEGQMDISSGDETSRFVAGEYIVFPANMTYTLICAETARLLIYRLLTAKIITELPDTLSQVINRLRVQGYIEDLNRHDNNLWLDPDAYGVNEVFRFKTVRRSRANQPRRRPGRCRTAGAERSILYALSSVKYEIKGVLVNGYGPAADAVTAVLEQRLHQWPVT